MLIDMNDVQRHMNRFDINCSEETYKDVYVRSDFEYDVLASGYPGEKLSVSVRDRNGFEKLELLPLEVVAIKWFGYRTPEIEQALEVGVPAEDIVA